jgi:hypothetical protein
MDRVLVLTFALLAPAIAGCLQVPLAPCEGSDCFPLSSDTLAELLSDPESFDILALASHESKLRVSTSTVYETEDDFAEIHWSVAKDDEAGLRSIAMRLVLGTSSIDTEVIEGSERTNVRLGNVWFEGRDRMPEYKDPFFDIAQKATENPEGLWPTFGFDTTSLASLDWAITSDELALQQVATGSNGTHTIILELSGLPPRIVGIELYGNDDSAFVLTIQTGDDVVLELQTDLPRAAIGFSIGEGTTFSDGITIWAGTIPHEFTSEVDPTELSFHAFTTADGTEGEAESGDEREVASMNLGDVSGNFTDENGDWWEFSYWDYSNDGWFSAGDFYDIRTNSTADSRIAIFDSWADSWTDAAFTTNSS